MFLFMFVEYSMRIVMGFIKPMEIAQAPPGGIDNFIIAPLSVILFIFALRIPNIRK
jgi:hypothetical protein